MSELECKIKHLELNDGDIVTVQGLSREEFHKMMGGLRQWRRNEKSPEILFVLLPEEGTMDVMSWEYLQEWHEERLKGD